NGPIGDPYAESRWQMSRRHRGLIVSRPLELGRHVGEVGVSVDVQTGRASIGRAGGQLRRNDIHLDSGIAARRPGAAGEVDPAVLGLARKLQCPAKLSGGADDLDAPADAHAVTNPKRDFWIDEIGLQLYLDDCVPAGPVGGPGNNQAVGRKKAKAQTDVFSDRVRRIGMGRWNDATFGRSREVCVLVVDGRNDQRVSDLYVELPSSDQPSRVVV